MKCCVSRYTGSCVTGGGLNSGPAMPVADTTQFRSYAVDFGIAECSEGGRHYRKVAADTAG